MQVEIIKVNPKQKPLSVSDFSCGDGIKIYEEIYIITNEKKLLSCCGYVQVNDLDYHLKNHLCKKASLKLIATVEE